MATVTGFTAARMLEIENASIVAGAVDLSGHLQLETQGGSTVDAGYVVGPAGPTGPGFIATVIAQTTNLNTIVVPGAYVQTTDAWATFALNYPWVGNGGWLTVTGTSGGVLLQTYSAVHDTEMPAIYTRESSNNGVSWTAWRPHPISNDSGAYRFIRDEYDTNVRITAGGSIDSYDLTDDITPAALGRSLWLNYNGGGHVVIGKPGVVTKNITLHMPVIANEGITSVKKIILSTDTTTDGVVEFGNGGQVREGGTTGGVMLQRAGDTANFIFVTDDGAPQARIPAAYSRTTASAPNMFVSTTGTLSRNTSLRAYKLNIDDAPADWAEKVLNLRPRVWTDKANIERYVDVLDREIAGEEVNWDEVEVSQIDERHPGFIAEEIVDIGLEIFASKDLDGTINGISYERISAALIMLAKSQQAQIDELKAQVASLIT